MYNIYIYSNKNIVNDECDQKLNIFFLFII